MLQAIDTDTTESLMAATACHGGGLADENCNTEWALMGRLTKARAEFEAAIAAVNANSALVSIDTEPVLAILSAELPDPESWEEKISSARHGWED